jgi:L-seryl-tRNA(Ser) seleniumtransferase
MAVDSQGRANGWIRVDHGAQHSELRQLPSVDRLLASQAAADWLGVYPRALVLDEIRAVIEELRRAITAGERGNGQPPQAGTLEAEITGEVGRRLERRARPSLRRVINATGVILHTNLGRAPLSETALEAIAATAGGYTNLEYDLAAGRRGQRDGHAAEPLERLLGAPAVVVNNNAAAIFLVLNELAAGGEVIVSRGELIEIGDGFRIPDILAKSGARLREVGTTNRTRIGDYRAAIGEPARLLLRVHPSNFRIVGFTERPALAALVTLARESGLPLVEDLGSGCLYDFATLGLAGEPPVAASLAAGADLVTFSGDKLLGGPQAGVIAGRQDLVRRVRRNPLFRALRADKLVYAALEATLRDYLLERYDRIPVLRMARQTPEQLRQRAVRFVESLGSDFPAELELVAGESVLGGGSTPGQGLPTTCIAIAPHKERASGPGDRIIAPRADRIIAPRADRTIAQVEERLRLGDPPVVARVENERLLLDLRTVLPGPQEEALRTALRAAVRG